MITLSLLSLFACAPGSVTTAGNATGGTNDSGTEAADADTDTGTDSDTAPPEPEYAPDLSVWNGTRTFFYDYSDYGYYCDATVTETGAEVTRGSSTYEVLRAECGDCTHFYEVTPSASEACDWIRLGTTWRGVRFDNNGGAVVHFYSAYGDELYEYAEVPNATFDGTDLRYGYDYLPYEDSDDFVVDVSGVVTYPQIPVEG